MESSTLVFVLTIVVAFIFLRWLISPIPQTNEFIPGQANGQANATGARSNQSNGQARRRNARPVSDSMIEVVQTIAPQLTREQIVYDLEKTGSVEVTIDNFMQNQTLPFPPGYVAPNVGETVGAGVASARAGANPAVRAPSSGKPADFKPVNLVEKYHVDVTGPMPEDADDDDLDTLLLKRKQRMILNARRELEKKLAE
ncbi:coupling of ubiquitin conjugation to ER degradation protein 1 [Diutina catenulata]